MVNDSFGCPFCDFAEKNHYFLLHHVETCHPEGGLPSPFTISDQSRHKSDVTKKREHGAKRSAEYIECQCGEFCLLDELESHLEMHYAERISFEETGRTASVKGISPRSTLLLGKPSSPRRQAFHSDSSKDVAPISNVQYTVDPPGKGRCPSSNRRGPNLVKGFFDVLRQSTTLSSKKPPHPGYPQIPRRLGRAELGPHAYEDRMPDWLRKQLEVGARTTSINQISCDGRLLRVENVINEVRETLPVLAQLCEQDQNLSRAYLCHPRVTHVIKLSKEGGFCGYRNIQMLLSYIRDAQAEGHQHFAGRLPSIIQLQDMIEAAWDHGFNSIGRLETGGIRGTRKYIGTPEAQALLQSLNIRCKAEAFNDGQSLPVHRRLLQAVEHYFSETQPIASRHSMTIVGLERCRNGTCNLLVLDPMFQPSPGIYRLLGAQFRTAAPERLLKAYRRGDSYLRKYSNFETLKQVTAAHTPGHR